MGRSHGRWLTLSCDDLYRAKDWFDRRGGIAVFAGCLIYRVIRWRRGDAAEHEPQAARA